MLIVDIGTNIGDSCNENMDQSHANYKDLFSHLIFWFACEVSFKLFVLYGSFNFAMTFSFVGVKSTVFFLINIFHSQKVEY